MFHSYAFHPETREIRIYRDGQHIATMVRPHAFTAAHSVVAGLNGGMARHAATTRTRRQQAKADYRASVGK